MFTNNFYHYNRRGPGIEWSTAIELLSDLGNAACDSTLQNIAGSLFYRCPCWAFWFFFIPFFFPLLSEVYLWVLSTKWKLKVYKNTGCILWWFTPSANLKNLKCKSARSLPQFKHIVNRWGCDDNGCFSTDASAMIFIKPVCLTCTFCIHLCTQQHLWIMKQSHKTEAKFCFLPPCLCTQTKNFTY